VPDLPDLGALLSASEAAALAGVSVAAVCNWAARGILPVATDGTGQPVRDSRGRPRYRMLDVAKAERATARRARRAAA
jgi:phage terminase Nu1 subunit (DNA packaging protein)